MSGVCPIGSNCTVPDVCQEGSLFDKYIITGSCTLCNQNGATPILCPEDYVCQAGFAEPRKCGWSAFCPDGSSKVIPTWFGILIVVVIGLVITILTLGLHYYRKWRVARSNRYGVAHQRTTEVYNSVVQSLTGVYLQAQKMQGFTNDIRYSPVDIRFENLTMTLKKGGRKILDYVSGTFPPGSLVAVMGPSGGGKTTFMNALSNRAPYGDVTGRIWINGFEGTFGEYPKQVGFVPQDDIMFDRLTVYQNLLYSAMVRLPREMPRKLKIKIVEDVIQVLDLEQIRHTVVGSPEKRGISGGQKKRVNIGIELVAYPRVLFLDEPTSGLDSAASMAVTKCLARMRTLGITVVCVIHQPRYAIFKQFTHCLLLGKGGKTVYLGRTNAIQDYFTDLGFELPAGENVADWFIDIVTGALPRSNPDGTVDRHFDTQSLFEAWNDYVDRMSDPTKEGGRAPKLTHKRVHGTMTVTVGSMLDSSDSDRVQSAEELGDRLSETLRVDCDHLLTGHDILRLCRILEIECSVDEAQELHRVLAAEHSTLTCASFAAAMYGEASEEVSILSHMVLPDCSRLKDREIASVWKQFLIFTNRNIELISIPQLFLDLSLTFMAAVIIGATVSGNAEYTLVPNNQMVGLMFFGIMVGAGALQVYGKEKLVFGRESSTGISIFAYWLSKSFVNLFDNVLVTLIFTCTWYLVTTPSYNIAHGFGIFLCFTWWVTGFAHLVTVVFPTEIALLLSVIVPTQFVTMFGGVSPPVTSLKTFQLWATYFGCGIYSVELLSLAEFMALPSNVLQIDEVVDLFDELDYNTSHIPRDFCVLVFVGLAWRLLTLAWLEFMLWWGQADLRWLTDRFKCKKAKRSSSEEIPQGIAVDAAPVGKEVSATVSSPGENGTNRTETSR
ncbi:hypothetical protein FOL47_005725 [Perkinsus chesapeaki]|uniref:ABC transporter domain-containing protein n=1 Tax=Perkinsus chesapeaki TaxID=330153 RepID=A0A7J6LVX6_PERCH|nr:hypothetical protein FOL47_005725 [Perkinsus chesapeaki]